ncbi:CD5 antigen-like [Camelus dromedarius]|uniref:CD5 antigen-like n=1 Tax=Camelus dromedarius TaxID=9838 RepID=A0A5N4CPL3_CAMDR|nr:CD5 antigen-like [Camelus dromedarius]
MLHLLFPQFQRRAAGWLAGMGRCKGVELNTNGHGAPYAKQAGISQLQVVCRQLGCGRAILTQRCCSKSTRGQGPIWLSAAQGNGARSVTMAGEKEEQVVCKQLGCGEPVFVSAKTGNMPHGSVGHHNCNHREDVAVECLVKPCRRDREGLAAREVERGRWGERWEQGCSPIICGNGARVGGYLGMPMRVVFPERPSNQPCTADLFRGVNEETLSQHEPGMQAPALYQAGKLVCTLLG